MTTATATKSPAYIDAKGVAKFVRKALRNAFPGIKFSVRSSSFDTLHISWADGPTAKQVEAVSDAFKGRGHSMDPYTDYVTEWDIEDNATGVANSVKYMFCHRDISEEARELFRAEVMDFAKASTYAELEDIWHNVDSQSKKSDIVWHFIAEMPVGSSWDVDRHLDYFESIALRSKALAA